MIQKISITLSAICFLALASCEKEKNNVANVAPDNLNGVFVVNEGAFGAGNASISFFSSDSAYSTTDVFQVVNGFPIGDLLQSMNIYNGKAYLCVNNSQKVEVVSMSDFSKTASIYGISSPRYFTAKANNFGYISDWGSNQVYKINLSSNTIVDSVTCGNGPEEMLIHNNQLYVCNSGGFTDDSTVSIVDLNSFTINSTMATGVNPASIRLDQNNKIWILCRGSLGGDFTPTPDDAGGKLQRLDPNSLAIDQNFNFNYDQHPVKLNTNATANTLYYLNGSSAYTGTVYKMDVNSLVLPAMPYINREFYALGIHPDDESIYGGKSSFSATTHILHYNNAGTLIDSSGVGVGPNGFVFN